MSLGFDTNNIVKKVPLLPAAPKIKKVPKTYCFDLTLGESNEKVYPEFSWATLVQEAKEKDAKEKIQSGGNLLDPYASDDEEDLKALAAKFEAKYSNSDKKGGKKKRKAEDYIDRGAGYDESDSFIDNADAYDEVVPQDIQPIHGGFYINSGSLEFKEEELDSPDEEFPPKNKKRKIPTIPRRKSTDSKGDAAPPKKDKPGVPVKRRNSKNNEKPMPSLNPVKNSGELKNIKRKKVFKDNGKRKETTSNSTSVPTVVTIASSSSSSSSSTSCSSSSSDSSSSSATTTESDSDEEKGENKSKTMKPTIISPAADRSKPTVKLTKEKPSTPPPVVKRLKTKNVPLNPKLHPKLPSTPPPNVKTVGRSGSPSVLNTSSPTSLFNSSSVLTSPSLLAGLNHNILNPNMLNCTSSSGMSSTILTNSILNSSVLSLGLSSSDLRNSLLLNSSTTSLLNSMGGSPSLLNPSATSTPKPSTSTAKSSQSLSKSSQSTPKSGSMSGNNLFAIPSSPAPKTSPQILGSMPKLTKQQERNKINKVQLQTPTLKRTTPASKPRLTPSPDLKHYQDSGLMKKTSLSISSPGEMKKTTSTIVKPRGPGAPKNTGLRGATAKTLLKNYKLQQEQLAARQQQQQFNSLLTGNINPGFRASSASGASGGGNIVEITKINTPPSSKSHLQQSSPQTSNYNSIPSAITLTEVNKGADREKTFGNQKIGNPKIPHSLTITPTGIPMASTQLAPPVTTSAGMSLNFLGRNNTSINNGNKKFTPYDVNAILGTNKNETESSSTSASIYPGGALINYTENNIRFGNGFNQQQQQQQQRK